METYIARINHLARFHRSLVRVSRPASRCFATLSGPDAVIRKTISKDVFSLATIPSCPPSTCACAATPEMPEGLPIDSESKLDGTMAPYDMHIVFRTGRSDWPSKIEDDEGLPEVKMLKAKLGRGGKYQNPFHNIMITTSDHAGGSSLGKDILLFPERKRLSSLPSNGTELDSDAFLEHLVRRHLLPRELSPRAKAMLPPDQHSTLIRDPVTGPTGVKAFDVEKEVAVSNINGFTVLICGHGGRDQRCGITGPILREEFARQLAETTFTDPVPGRHARHTVEMISHIGGHKFAGNVIIYPPPRNTPLRRMGIWYGRVEPKHVQGIIRETMINGKIIKDLFRGGIDGRGGIFRLADAERVVSSFNV